MVTLSTLGFFSKVRRGQAFFESGAGRSRGLGYRGWGYLAGAIHFLHVLSGVHPRLSSWHLMKMREIPCVYAGLVKITLR